MVFLVGKVTVEDFPCCLGFFSGVVETHHFLCQRKIRFKIDLQQTILEHTLHNPSPTSFWNCGMPELSCFFCWIFFFKKETSLQYSTLPFLLACQHHVPHSIRILWAKNRGSKNQLPQKSIFFGGWAPTWSDKCLVKGGVQAICRPILLVWLTNQCY